MHPQAQLVVDADLPSVHSMSEVLRALGWKRECNFRDVVLYEHTGFSGRQCILCPVEAADYGEICTANFERLVALHGFVCVHSAAAAQHVDAYLHLMMLRSFEAHCRRTYA